MSQISQTEQLKRETAEQKPFVKLNFIFMIVALVMIVLGFALMSGSANGDVPGFNEDIFSVRRIIIGPGIAFLGFVGMAFAIIYTPKQKH
ncbi:MAG: DUF3098 domain-containing protein [Bacteroidales bacterium]|nr:DUF3098 domain-containing protein [Bacteroidales bacterium]